MRSSEEKINRTLQSQIQQSLYQTISDLQNPQEAQEFFEDFLTESEQLALIKRLGLVLFLDQKRSYENIKENLKVSSATIACFYKKLGRPGIQLAIRKVKTEAWAEKWSQKISRLFQKLSFKML